MITEKLWSIHVNNEIVKAFHYHVEVVLLQEINS